MRITNGRGSLLKKNWFVLIGLLLLAGVISGCNVSEASGRTTVKLNENSEYVKTFKDLHLGEVLDFDLTWADADETEVTIWTEQYKDGKMGTEQAGGISFSESPEKSEKGHLGMGIVHYDEKKAMVVVYGPGVSGKSEEIELDYSGSAYGWEKAVDAEKIELELGKTYILGAYRISKDSHIQSYNLKDKNEVEKMIKEDRTGFLLKVKTEKK